ncbi:uncharacterized protein LOC111375900 [Olea europaea var. sylvestris]|uniref:uncharacterized protein LOC111375900 n=1 Tax=Olea europaea var. sylvestris TaxID=158386 RepID=UPI000C1D4922|nr:uncharacterized protein LOC111375900 [Olea europaea var. sylvestris]
MFTSIALVEKLNLTLLKHPRPYKLQWLNESGEVRVNRRVLINISNGSYRDKIICDVVSMQAGHILLGRTCQYDRKVMHDGYKNCYSFVKDGRPITLVLLTSVQVLEDQIKLRNEEEGKRSELEKRREIYEQEKQRENYEIVSKRENCEEFQEVFLKDIPSGLPPIRRIEHQIDFIAGAIIHNRPAYRSNPDETKKFQRQVEELMEKAMFRNA